MTAMNVHNDTIKAFHVPLDRLPPTPHQALHCIRATEASDYLPYCCKPQSS